MPRYARPTRRRKPYRRPTRRYSRPGYRGRGAYKAPRTAAWGAAAGNALGSLVSYTPFKAAAPVAQYLGGKIGGWLGDRLGRVTGWGAYKVKYNTLSEGGAGPLMHASTRQGATNRFYRREYITDIISSDTNGAFKLQNFQLNPASQISFPWLSDVAVNWQKYKIKGAIMEFESSSGDALTGTNTALGMVLISSNYNCADPNFVNRQQMENTMYSTRAKPSENQVHIIECDPSIQAQTSLYTATNAIPTNGNSLNDVNWVNVQIATIGLQGQNVNVGSLYINYDVELIQPIDRQEYLIYKSDWFSMDDDGVAAPGAPLGAAEFILERTANNLGGSFTAIDTYSFPPQLQSGMFRVTYYYIPPDDATPITLPTLNPTNCVARVCMGSNPPLSAVAANQTVTDTMILTAIYEVTGQNASILFTGGTYSPSLPQQAAFMVDQVNQGLNNVPV